MSEKGMFGNGYRQEPNMIDECECIMRDSYVRSNMNSSLLKIIQLSEKDVQAGRTEPATMVFQELRRKYNVGK